MVAVPDRSSFTAKDSVEYIWNSLGLPAESLDALDLKGSGSGLPSSFKIADLAQASIGLSALLAAQIHALRNAPRDYTPSPANRPKPSGAPSAASTRHPTATSASTTASPTTAPAQKLYSGAPHPPTAPPSAPPSPPGAPSTSKPPPPTPAASSPP
ncbi:hypothetical protein CNMCM6106_007744 [Aspergillus hiratsukae]|uniref:Uncharacterized protein n=1 Tax=Aspergillus hiratsukae TaxID=1194566 RepID=A0A8H6QHE8_9EURO|nr:hypothetical protein CNMCM6106_007744 [Aspergillus hiratsukae]